MENKNKNLEDMEFELNGRILEVARNTDKKSTDFPESFETQIKYSLLPYFGNSYKEIKKFIKNQEIFSEPEYKDNIDIILDKIKSMNNFESIKNEKSPIYNLSESIYNKIISLVEKYA